MRIKATLVAATDLVAGDLFSVAGPEYWDAVDRIKSVGELVYIRTNTPAAAPDADALIYKIEVEK